MNEKQQGYLLTGLVALGIALIFLIIRFTEGPVVWLAGTIGFALAGVAAGCFGIAITISVMEKRPWASVAERLERQGERNGRCIGDSHLHYANGIVGISQGHNVFTNTLIYAALPEFYAILGLVGALMV